MSNTFPSLRPDGVSFLQDHEQRIRELEATPPPSEALIFAFASQVGSQTFTSPTGYDDIPDSSNFSTNSASLFQQNATYDAIDCLVDTYPLHVKGTTLVQRNGAGHANPPEYIALGLTEWVTASGSPGSNFFSDSVTKMAIPSTATDNQFGNLGLGYRLHFLMTGFQARAARSYALWLSVDGVAADWAYGASSLALYNEGI